MDVSRTPERMFAPEDMENLRMLEKRILASVDTGAVVRAHRKENGYLKELDEAIEGLTAVYNSAVHDREPLEGVFVTKIDILLGMARRFHPLSEYGRETLDKAVACRMDFEELAGPLLTRITTDNLDRFGSVLSPDLMEDIAVGKHQALGALRSSGRDVHAAGAIVFDIERAGLDDEEILRVKWLYVADEWRERGVANFLIGEMVHFMAEQGSPAMTVDLYVDDNTELYGDLFSEWHFLFAGSVSPELAFALNDISERSAFEKYEDKATSLLELQDKEEDVLVREFLAERDYRGYLSGEDLPGDYIETELSCFSGSRARPDGLMLAHRYPSGRISIEYNASSSEEEDRTEEMLGALTLTAMYKYDRTTEVVMNERFIEDDELLDELFRRQRAQYMIEGILTSPDAPMDAAAVAQYTGVDMED